MNARTELVSQVFHRHLPARRTLDERTNFFEAGFTSTLLATVLADLTGAGVELALVDLFRFPTLGELFAELDRRADTPAGPAVRAALPWEK